MSHVLMPDVSTLFVISGKVPIGTMPVIVLFVDRELWGLRV